MSIYLCVRWKCSENVNTINMMYAVVAISNKSQIQSIDFDDQINRNDCVSERKNDVFAYVFGQNASQNVNKSTFIMGFETAWDSIPNKHWKQKQIRTNERTNDVEHFEILKWFHGPTILIFAITSLTLYNKCFFPFWKSFIMR